MAAAAERGSGHAEEYLRSAFAAANAYARGGGGDGSNSGDGRCLGSGSGGGGRGEGGDSLPSVAVVAIDAVDVLAPSRAGSEVAMSANRVRTARRSVVHVLFTSSFLLCSSSFVCFAFLDRVAQLLTLLDGARCVARCCRTVARRPHAKSLRYRRRRLVQLTTRASSSPLVYAPHPLRSRSVSSCLLVFSSSCLRPLRTVRSFEEMKGVVVVAMTDRPDAVDPALRRPGRLDRELAVPPPNREARAEVLRCHTRGDAFAALRRRSDGASATVSFLLCTVTFTRILLTI